MAHYEAGTSSSTTPLSVPELTRQKEELLQKAIEYVNSMEVLCQRKEELAEKKYQEKLEALAAKKEVVDGLKTTIAAVKSDAEEYDRNMLELKEEIALIQENIIDLRRRKTRNLTGVNTLRELIDHTDNLDELICAILHGKVTEKIFLENLEILQDKIGYVRNKDENPHWHKDSQCRPICTIYEKLRTIAILKVAKYVASHISKFCSVIVTKCEFPEDLGTFLKHYQFILLNEPDLVQKMINKYVRYKQKIYHNYFGSLVNFWKLCVLKKNIETDPETGPEKGPEKDHVKIYMATDTSEQVEEIVEKHFSFSGRTTLFLDITKYEVAKDYEYQFEDVFKNFHIELVELIDMENKFLNVIFLLDRKKRSEVLSQIMEKCLTSLFHSWKVYFGPMNDPVTSLLCFHIVHRFRSLSHLNEIDIFDKYWDTLERVTLRRYNDTILLNIHSINNYDVTKYEYDSGAHFIVKRYAKYTAEVRRIHGAFPQPVIADILKVLRKTINDFCIRVAKSLPNKRYEMVFLINCYQEIIDAMCERVEGDIKDDLKEYIDQLPTLSGEYILAVLQHYLGDMLSYVDEIEIYAITGNTAKMDEYAPIAKKIIQEYNEDWQSNLNSIHKNGLISFKNIITAYNILKGTLKMYLHYVTRFRDTLTKSDKDDFVDIMEVIVELEKIRRQHQAIDDLPNIKY